jgi:hypothetical protein
MKLNGGEGGIRTHDTVARMPHFECGAFDHSATSPRNQSFNRRGVLITSIPMRCKGQIGNFNQDQRFDVLGAIYALLGVVCTHVRHQKSSVLNRNECFVWA